MRILCDYLTVLGFLKKKGERYLLTKDSATFLDRNSPAYAGGAAEFLLSDHLTQAFADVAGAVRKGGTVHDGGGSSERHEHCGEGSRHGRRKTGGRLHVKPGPHLTEESCERWLDLRADERPVLHHPWTG